MESVKKKTLVATKTTKKTSTAIIKSHPQKSKSHNIKLYDFYLNMIYFIFIKYLVIV